MEDLIEKNVTNTNLSTLTTLTLCHTRNNDLDGAGVVGHCHRRIGKPGGSAGGPRNGAANAALALVAKSNAALGRLFDDVRVRFGAGTGVCCTS